MDDMHWDGYVRLKFTTQARNPDGKSKLISK